MFRPCIDLHEGKVKQIVGATLTDNGSGLRTHFVSDRPAAWYAELFKRDGLTGGHVIMLGPGNEAEARRALGAYPGGLQIGGGITPENACAWLDAGASHVIVTSWVFSEGKLDRGRLSAISRLVGRERLVLDLSCRKVGGDYRVVAKKWQQLTDLILSGPVLAELAEYCTEFLVHAVDREGLRAGIDRELVSKLAEWSPVPVTYAGGANSIDDLEEVTRLGQGKVDLTIGSALDIFGGTQVRYADCVEFNRRELARRSSAAAG
ncbi:MAG: phosphoribosylformimino-5-aminoimidazole carboxamide ribotide isomerase [Verrucomicrobiae bacterium]|nr:phosphoribosylformimino-5-aminoimidazole carboxamide ribotide isomerase [Verrucomicrobiae bacterium]MDW7980772.1 phosphoribosylformimino-5-aminoimidazole carboxamide ribotide isomerase [Verrucomicrobiales bacterium]